MKATIEQRFGEVLRFAEETFGKNKGFQARLSELTGVRGSNINEAMRRDKGLSEPRRRAIFKATVQLVPDLQVRTYDDFLDFGQHLLDGNDPAAWQPTKYAAPTTITATGTGNAAGTITGSKKSQIVGGQASGHHQVAMDENEWFLWQVYKRIPATKRQEVLEACQLRLMRMVGQLVAE